jgi:hypothetical protein
MELNREATDETEIEFVPFHLDCVRVALIPAAGVFLSRHINSYSAQKLFVHCCIILFIFYMLMKFPKNLLFTYVDSFKRWEYFCCNISNFVRKCVHIAQSQYFSEIALRYILLDCVINGDINSRKTILADYGKSNQEHKYNHKSCCCAGKNKTLIEITPVGTTL